MRDCQKPKGSATHSGALRRATREEKRPSGALRLAASAAVVRAARATGAGR